MASTLRALILSSQPLAACSPRRLLALPSTAALAARRRLGPSVICCLVSGVGGGGASDTTRNSEFSREFAVIANMLQRIEPLDASVISKGVSDSAKDSMKQTISTMLGLLPSDQFSVSVGASKLPLHRLLVSSIITGYTLWNAGYRISLMRNFELSLDGVLESSSCVESTSVLELGCEEGRNGAGEVSGGNTSCEGLETSDCMKDLSPEASSYVQLLETELSSVKKELDAQKQELTRMESDRGNGNNLLEYLRSLESEMVIELSQPSSTEVKEVIHQLSRNILQRFFKDDTSKEHKGDRAIPRTGVPQDAVNDHGEFTTTSRDYLAKLLFWCMLLGHHLRGLENRINLSCAVGLL